MIENNYRYLFLYLAITFGGWWGAALFLKFFGNFLHPFIGQLTLLHPLIIFFTYLPSIAGLFIYYLMGGGAAVKEIVFKLIPRKQDLFWFAVLIVGFIFFVFTMRFGCLLFGVKVPTITYSIPQMISKALLNMILETGIIGGTFGWVGFLLPFLQGKLRNNISSGLLTGLILGLWVFPGFAISSSATNTSYILYVMQLMTFFLFQSYVFNATKGNLTFYLFTFWLIATGSHIQLYYFNIPIQVMQIVFFVVASLITHIVFNKIKINAPLQTLEYIADETNSACHINYNER